MHSTYWEIIRDAAMSALFLPADGVSEDILEIGLAAANEAAEEIWLSWPFDNEKMDEFETPAPDDDGIITFGSDVESVRALRAISTDAVTGIERTQAIWNEVDVLAAYSGGSVSSDRFQHLAATSAGLRRIRVAIPTDGSTPTYKALGLKKYTKATIEGAYDSEDPTATPTDYRVMTFVLDRAEGALRAKVKDALRMAQGMQTVGNGDALLQLALRREMIDSDREQRVNVRTPMFDEVGDWR